MAAKVPALLHKMSVSSQKAWYKKNNMPLPGHLTGGEGKSAAQAKKDVGDINKEKAKADRLKTIAAAAKKVIKPSSDRVRAMRHNADAWGGGLGGGLDRNRDIIGHVRAGGTIKAGRLGEETKSAGGPMSLAQKLAKQAMSMQKKTPGADVPADKQIAQQMGEDTIVEHDDNEHEYDHEGEMAKTQLRGMMMHAKKLHDMLEDDTNLPEWVQSKLTLAADYLQTASDYMDSQDDDDLDEEVQIDEKYMGFKALKAKISAKGGARDAGAVAAAIGRKKYGKAAFQKAAAKGEKLGEEAEQIDEARINHRDFAADGVMHPEHANQKYMKPGNHVDFYSSKNGDKLYGKVLKNDGKNVHIRAELPHENKGEVHKFRVSATAPHQMKEALDPVGHEDKDVNNDGKVDKNDKYLLNRRASIAKAIKDKMAKKLGK